MTAPKLILFDLVSTLTNAGPRYAKAYQQVCESYNIPQPSHDDLLAALGNKNLKQIIQVHSPEITDDLMPAFMNDCNRVCDTILTDVHWTEHLFPHTRETLKTLKDNGITIGLFTGTREDAMLFQIRYHNLLEFFDTQFLCGKNNQRDGMVSTQFLKSQQLLQMCETWNLRYPQSSRNDIIVVGDSITDFEAAHSLGLSFIAFAPELKTQNNFRNYGITDMISCLSQISKTLKNQDFPLDEPAKVNYSFVPLFTA